MSNIPKANKDLGQHFLKDQNVIRNITHDFNELADTIVEIGPGPAILTKSLSSHDKDLFVIEKDTRFEDLLLNSVKKENIFFEDALKFDWESFIRRNNLKNIWLVSNLPYNISAPLFLSFQRIKEINFMTLMFQKEVGEKTYVKPTLKNQMSSLLAISNNYFESKELMKVLPGAFNPPPKVDSVVVSYTRKTSPEVSINQFEKYERFLRIIFKFKRKQLGSVLKGHIKDLKQFFEQTQIKREVRAESLNMEEIYELFNLYNSNSV